MHLLFVFKSCWSFCFRIWLTHHKSHNQITIDDLISSQWRCATQKRSLKMITFIKVSRLVYSLSAKHCTVPWIWLCWLHHIILQNNYLPSNCPQAICTYAWYAWVNMSEISSTCLGQHGIFGAATPNQFPWSSPLPSFAGNPFVTSPSPFCFVGTSVRP